MRVDSLSAGLASIASQWDDSPNTRGALAFCRSISDHREAQARVAAVPDQAFTDHAALVVANAFRSRDFRGLTYGQYLAGAGQ